MSLPALPAELIDAVAQNLDTPALVALARTASPLYPVARRLLYRNLALSPLAHNLVLVPVLAARPHLARFVRTFSLVLPSSSVLFPPFYRALASALAAMTQLTDLDLHIDPDATWVLASAPLYPRLSHFAASFPLDLHTAHFLARTPALEHLQLDSVSLPPPTPPPLPAPAPAPAPTPATPSLPPLPPSTVSILASFSGPAHIARLLAPTRPLHTLHIHDGDLTPDDCAWLATAAGPLAVLSATATAATAAPPLVPLLHALARALPDLACLRLAPPTTTTASPGTGAPTAPALLKAPDTTFYEHVARALALMPALKDFELDGMHWGSAPAAALDPDKHAPRVWQSAPLVPTTGPLELEPALALLAFSAPDAREDAPEGEEWYSSEFAFYPY